MHYPVHPAPEKQPSCEDCRRMPFDQKVIEHIKSCPVVLLCSMSLQTRQIARHTRFGTATNGRQPFRCRVVGIVGMVEPFFHLTTCELDHSFASVLLGKSTISLQEKPQPSFYLSSTDSRIKLALSLVEGDFLNRELLVWCRLKRGNITTKRQRLIRVPRIET
jgi:hypothetical protein